jgi:hypothetical protein
VQGEGIEDEGDNSFTHSKRERGDNSFTHSNIEKKKEKKA